jgi:hypothetical protein
MAGGDVLVAGTTSVPNPGANCFEGANPDFTSRFGRFDGIDGSTKWLENYKSPDDCQESGVDIGGIADGRVYGVIQTWLGGFGEFSRSYVVQYDVDGTLLTEEPYGISSNWVNDMMVGANDRVFVGGDDGIYGWVAEVDVDGGAPLWSVGSLWNIELHEFNALDVFDNGEFAIVAFDGRVARISQAEQVAWVTDAVGFSNTDRIDVGGPFDTVAAVRVGNIVDVFDAAGNPQWQASGTSVAIDPNGDVFVIVGNDLEKRAGADGALLCTIVLNGPGHSLAIDEQGAPIVLDNQSITKYAP